MSEFYRALMRFRATQQQHKALEQLIRAETALYRLDGRPLYRQNRINLVMGLITGEATAAVRDIGSFAQDRETTPFDRRIRGEG